MKTHVVLESESAIFYRSKTIVGAVAISVSKLGTLFFPSKVTLEREKKVVSMPAFSKRWAGRFQLKQGEEPRLKRLKTKYHF